MVPPNKRALFSVNLDTDTDHIYQRVDDHSKEGKNKVKVLETSGPSHGHTDLTFVTNPFEKLVNRAVEGVVEGTGKKIHSAEGELTYSTQTSKSGTGNKTVTVKRSPGKKNIEDSYDTSDL